MRLVLFAALLGGTSLLAVVACSSSSTAPGPEADGGPEASDSDASDVADAGPALPFPLNQVCAPNNDPNACYKCDFEHCCDSRARAATDGGKAMSNCLAPEQPDGAPIACDLACETACFESAPGEVAPFLEHLACASHFCAVECGGNPDACFTCAQTNCLQETVACDLSRDCFLARSCIGACNGSPACIKDCDARFPQGSALSNTVFVCTMNHCSRECG